MTDQEIQNKAKKYFEAGKKYEALTDELIEFLGTDILNAPASPSADMHNAFEGGLIDHMLTTSKHAVNLNEQLPDSVKQDKNKLIKVSLLHQIGKTFLFKKQTDQWRRKNLNENFTYNNDVVSLKVGERTAFYAMKYGVDLTEDEYQAIVNFDKEFDKQATYFNGNLGDLLKQANKLAIMEEKAENNE